MEDIFSPNGMLLVYFVGTTAMFLNAALILFGLKGDAQKWLTFTAFITFVLWWALLIATPRPLSLKWFTTLLLLSLIVMWLIRRGRKLKASG